MNRCQISEVKCVRIKHQTYIFSVLSSVEQKPFFVGRTAAEISEFRNKLLEEFRNNKDILIPNFKGVKWYESNKDEKKRKAVDDFCQQVLQLPEKLKASDTVVHFFTSSAADSEESVGRTGRKDSSSTDSTKVLTTQTSQQATTIVDESSFDQYEDISNFQTTNIITLTSNTTNNTTSASIAGPAIYAEVLKPGIVKPSSQPSLPVRNIVNNNSAADIHETTTYAEIPTCDSLDETGLYSECKSPDFSDCTVQARVALVSTDECAPILPSKVSTSSQNSESSSLSNSATLAANITNGSEQQMSPVNSAGLMPLTPIPPIPQMTAPPLSSSSEIPERYDLCCDPNEIQVIAIADYTSSAENILSFNKGNMATLVIQSDTKWWCIKQGSTYGWVPADYWRMLNPGGDCANLNIKGSAPWFVGKLSRSECEELLMQHGKPQHFVVRESTNLVGHFALSVKHNDRVHHFPIELTQDQRYYIGKHHFKTVNNVIAYYQKNALFYDENGEDVTLGSPLVVIKH